MNNQTKELNKMSDKFRYNLTDVLTVNEMTRLEDLFDKIKLDLSDDSFPTRTNRLEAVENMKKVLEIHNYEISEYKPEEPKVVADALDHHQIMQKGIVR
tara:strand:+ start:9 stop:305 length:297 start_codon:yes stop_codon:yes gene_type:complete